MRDIVLPQIRTEPKQEAPSERPETALPQTHSTGSSTASDERLDVIDHRRSSVTSVEDLMESRDNTKPPSKYKLRSVPEGSLTVAEEERMVNEILKLDRDPVRALEKALQMPKFFKAKR